MRSASYSRERIDDSPAGMESQLAKEDVDLLDDDLKSTINRRINQEKPRGPLIHPDFARLIESVVVNGLKQKEREEIMEKFPLPENCQLIEPPKMNLEVKSAVQENVIARDFRIIKMQEKIEACIIAAVTTLDKYSKVPDANRELLESLNDVCSLLADVQHDESVIRRSIILANLNTGMKTSLMTTRIDEYLFGNKLDEVIRSAKAIENSTKELKVAKNFNTATRYSKNGKFPPRQKKTNFTTSGGSRRSQRRNSSHSYPPKPRGKSPDRRRRR